ncbi:non-ribosomal peptide synthetase [Herpetosiphon geysericola]|uniref:non-ribosomal peptide synthetase n=1 Tax=Herpetosiphon geysericola TaxID=70996 RepID=UPI0006C90691|nr:non-ribosomal peptide synthetase [Herpetosiphon geysericola]
MNDYSERLAALSPAKRALLLQKVQAKGTKPAQQIQPRPDQNSYPLSFAQQRLWLIEQLQPNAALYNVSIPMQIRGSYSNLTSILSQTLTAIVQRHEPLRASFSMVDGLPQQAIMAVEHIDIALSDFSQLNASEREAALHQAIQTETEQPFDLRHDQLFRAKLLRISDAEHILLLTMHHIAFDAWSAKIFIQEFEAIFTALENQQPLPQLAPLALQYADFAAWQREWLQGATLDQQLSYWKTQLAGELPVLALPTDRPRPAIQTFKGGRHTFWISGELTNQLNQLSQQQQATLFMLLLSAWVCLLQRYSGQNDIIVGSPIANRNRRELEDLIGFFVNTLVMRVKTTNDPSFLELLAQVREVALGAYAHQDLPFEMLVDALQPSRDLSRSALFQVLFVLQNVAIGGSHSGLDILEDVASPSKFDLTLSLVEFDNGLRATIEYNVDLFDASTIERMGQHYVTLLSSITQQPQAKLSQLAMLTPAEQTQIIKDWNTSSQAYPNQQLFPQLFEAQVAKTPTAIALIGEDQALSYQELNQRANQLAYRLQAQGIGPESLVGIYCDRSLAMVIALLAILKAGAAYLPLDPAYPSERLEWMLNDSKLELVLSQRHLLEKVQALKHNELTILDLATICDGSEPTDNCSSMVQPSNLAYLIYTSGSTGKPKAVMVNHQGLSNLVTAQIAGFGVTAQSRVLQFASLSFDAAISEIGMALLAGASLVLMPAGGLAAGTDVLGFIRQHNVSVATLPPSLLTVLPADQTPSLTTLITAGEASSNELVQRWAVDRRLINAYGPTETTVCASLTQLEPSLTTTPPIGRPLANLQIYLLDQHQNIVPVGVIGEIYIGGVGVARGYRNRPELTAERFVPDQFSSIPGQRLYRTGDLGRYRTDGQIEFIGRIDQQIKLRGHRIELGEISSIVNAHPAVEQSVVLLHDQASSTARLIAYVVANATAADSTNELQHAVGTNQPPAPYDLAADLQAYAKQQLPAFAVPAAFVVVEAMPLTPNGKIDYRSLAQQAPSHNQASGQTLEPQNNLEQTITSLWQEILQQAPISTQANFFDLGGNSLAMVQVHSRLQELLGRELVLLDLFKYPTIQTLAAYLSSEQSTQASTFVDHANRAQQQRQALQRQRRRR